MAPGKHDEIRELLAPGDGGVVELSTERLEQLYLEVAPQVRQISSTTLSPNLFLKLLAITLTPNSSLCVPS